MRCVKKDYYRVAAVLLAGGKGERMEGQDKGLVSFDGQPMISWSIAKVSPRVERLLISCNRNLERYKSFGFDLVCDHYAGFQGPLAGIHAALTELNDEYTHLLVLPCDTPYLDSALLDVLISESQQQNEAICLLSVNDQPQFLHAVIPTRYAKNLEHQLDRAERAVYRWYKQFPMHLIRIDVDESVFRNVNSLEN